MRLGELHPHQGAVRPRKRIGRGTGSGHGSTSGRGTKGLLSRSGGRKKIPSWFEGGQMPLQRRLPKRGFKHFKDPSYQIVNLGDLRRCGGVQTITPEVLAERGLIRKATKPVKILGSGEITQAFEVQVQAFSASAVEKIQQAGGKAIVRI